MSLTHLQTETLVDELLTIIADRSKDRRLSSRPFYRSIEIKLELAREFGRRNGWRLSKHWFTWGQLARGSHCRTRQDCFDGLPNPHAAADHRYFFRRDRRPAALVVHLYNWSVCRPDVAKVCDRYGLAAREVDDFPSWWYPGATTLIVYEPAAAALRGVSDERRTRHEVTRPVCLR